MKVLYIYSGIRKGKFKGEISKDYSDTPFYGLNHLSKFGIDAEFREFSDICSSPFIQKITPFRIKHFLLVFHYSLSKKYDIIFGSSLLYGLFLKKIFRIKPKFVFFDISLGRTLSANRNKKIKYSFLVWLMKEPDAVVCLSNVQKENLEKKLPFLKGKIFFCPLGVDVTYHTPRFDTKNDSILSVGRDNGRDYKTVFEVARKMQDRKFEIICSERNIAGLDIKLPNTVVNFDLPLSVTYGKFVEAQFLLLITHDDTYLDGSDCSGQTVLLEAMSCGLPIIVSRKRYLEDYVRDGKDALFVNFYDVPDIMKKIERFGDASFRENIARNARKTAEEKFSTEKMAERLAQIFKKI